MTRYFFRLFTLNPVHISIFIASRRLKEYPSVLDSLLSILAYSCIAVKSGTSVFNADSRKRQEQNFSAAAKRAQQARKAFVPVIGYGYGKKKLRAGTIYLELAGQDFWWWLSGDPDFYLKIIDLMGTRPDEYADIFRQAYNRALNRMVRDFSMDFCLADGSINWDKLVQFNSGHE